jgi:hypothetical protein
MSANPDVKAVVTDDWYLTSRLDRPMRQRPAPFKCSNKSPPRSLPRFERAFGPQTATPRQAH